MVPGPGRPAALRGAPRTARRPASPRRPPAARSGPDVSGTSTPPSASITNHTTLASASTASARSVPPSSSPRPVKATPPSTTTGTAHTAAPPGRQPRSIATAPMTTNWPTHHRGDADALAGDQQRPGHTGRGQPFEDAVAPVEGGADGLRGEGAGHHGQGDHAGYHGVDPRGRQVDHGQVGHADQHGQRDDQGQQQLLAVAQLDAQLGRRSRPHHAAGGGRAGVGTERPGRERLGGVRGHGRTSRPVSCR